MRGSGERASNASKCSAAAAHKRLVWCLADSWVTTGGRGPLPLGRLGGDLGLGARGDLAHRGDPPPKM